VIDVTDPGSPAYCFVSLSETTESELGVPINEPLSAEQYLRIYYTTEDSEDMPQTRITQEQLSSIVSILHGEKLVTLEMVADAWPHEYGDKLKKAKPTMGPSTEGVPTNSGVPPLAALLVDPSVKHALATGNTTQIEEIAWMPDKIEGFKAALQDVSPFPDSGMPLLKEVISQEMKSGDGAVDFSGYALSSAQVLQVVSSLNDVKALNLSYKSDVTTDTIRQLLTSALHLKRLVLLGCDAITDDDIKEMLTLEPKLFYRLEALIHPCFLSEQASYPNAFSYIGVVEDRNMVTSCSLAYFSPSSIVQALTDFLRGLTAEDPSFHSGGLGTSLAPLSVFCAAAREPGQKWGERSVITFPQSSHAAFEGEGWAFVLSSLMYGKSEGRNIWGFVRRVTKESEDGWKPPNLFSSAIGSFPDMWLGGIGCREAPPFEVLDLRSFLARTVEEGRPPVAEEAIVKLEGILKKMEEVRGARLAGVMDMGRFIVKANLFLKHSY
jgi:hypothetical protein